MRILRVVSDLYPSSVGGLGLHAHELSKAQASMGHEVTVLTTKVDNSPTIESRDGYQIIRLRPVFSPLGNAFLPTLPFQIANQRDSYDIIHAHSHLFFTTNICALMRKGSSTPLVITNHGIISASAPARLQSIYLNTIAKWTYAEADKIICYTDEDKRGLEKIGVSEDKIETIHNGIDIKLFSARPKRTLNNKILWAGRFVPGKGVNYLVDAFAEISNTFPELKLVLVGDGPSRESIREQISKLNLEQKVIIKDFVPNSGMVNLYRESDIFVLPSLHEGIPRTILEAMACGVPVVCTELPHLKKLVKSCGLTVPARDAQSLADAITSILLDEGQRKSMSLNGVKRINTHYSWDDTVARTINLYERIIANADESEHIHSINTIESNDISDEIT